MRGRQQVLLFTIVGGATLLSSAACGKFLGISNDEDDPPVSTRASDGGDGSSSLTDAIGAADGSSVIPSDGNGGELDADADFVPPVKVIFLSNTLFVPTPPGGREHLDQLCQAQAVAAGIAPTKVVIAWMSITGSGAIDRLGPGDWRMPSSDNGGVNPPIQIFAGKASIPNGPLSPINRGADGMIVSPTSDRVWTGTRASGMASGYDCINWGAQTGSAGTAGAVGVTGLDWTDNNANPGMSCDIEGYIICIEQ